MRFIVISVVVFTVSDHNNAMMSNILLKYLFITKDLHQELANRNQVSVFVESNDKYLN